jgi:carbon-monoxide dehydrogenase large subunit/6-hydroxypseudooxynicotine dehydrogenase subunit gamma
VTFADYLMPTAHEVPNVDVLLSEDAPSSTNPLGLKGAGEGGIAAVGAVIASAVDDALGGIATIAELPIKPQMLKARIDANRSGKMKASCRESSAPESGPQDLDDVPAA